MPDGRRKHCRVCGRHTDEAGPLSWTGLCIDDARAELESNIDQMHERRGPNFDKWRRSMAACVGGLLIDDVIPPA